MKKYLSLLLITITTLSFVGCGNENSDGDISSESTQVESASETSEEVASVSESEIDDRTETSVTYSYVNGAGDITEAIDGTTTSETAAAPLGEWVASTMWASEDDTYHTVYIRITKVTTQSEDEDYVQAAIDLHNEIATSFDYIDLSDEDYQISDEVEWCILDYEIYIPEDVPSGELGFSEFERTVLFFEYVVGNGDTEGVLLSDGETYIGDVSDNEELYVYDDSERYMPGNTYSFKKLFPMIIGCEDYVIATTTYLEGTIDEEKTSDEWYVVWFENGR